MAGDTLWSAPKPEAVIEFDYVAPLRGPALPTPLAKIAGKEINLSTIASRLVSGYDSRDLRILGLTAEEEPISQAQGVG